MAKKPNDKKETLLEAGIALSIMMGVMIVLAWITSSHRIVNATIPSGLAAANLWKLVPGELGSDQWDWCVEWARRAQADLNAVGFPQWIAFVNVAFQPIFAVMLVLYAPIAVVLGIRRKTVQRRFTPDDLIRISSERFTGNLPILTIRSQIAANKLPLWRLPVQPEEVLKSWKVPGDYAQTKDVRAGRPIANFRQPAFDEKVAHLYFMGIKQSSPGQQRMESAMIGRQVVDLMRDSAGAGHIVFADRMSNEGKALLALWAPVCFDGAPGREAYQKLKDALNRSAYGTANGLANLTLAQQQYDKYRNHPQLRQIFAVHHWEFTVLMALLQRAQRFGVITTAEVLWLRPMNRILFAVLNSCGRHTPHLEGAAAFGMHRFEVECARMKRLPVHRDPETGRLQHTIFVGKAVAALRDEFLHLVDSVDDDEEIWMDKSAWERTNSAVVHWMQEAEQRAQDAAREAGRPDMDNDFDRGEHVGANAREVAPEDDELADF